MHTEYKFTYVIMITELNDQVYCIKIFLIMLTAFIYRKLVINSINLIRDKIE